MKVITYVGSGPRPQFAMPRDDVVEPFALTPRALWEEAQTLKLR